MERLLTVREVSELSGVTEITVRRWIKGKTIPSYLIGGARRFNYQEVINHIKGADKK